MQKKFTTIDIQPCVLSKRKKQRRIVPERCFNRAVFVNGLIRKRNRIARKRGRVPLIIDGDLRKPRMHEIFHLPNGRGFSSLLCAPALPPEPLDGLVQETSIRGLFVLPGGPPTESSAILLHSANLSELLAKFKREFDVVIIDTPPMLQMPDARVLGHMADAVILVTRAGHTTRDAAVAASQRFAADRTRVLGTILNDWDPSKTSHGGYGYGGRYYHYYIAAHK